MNKEQIDALLDTALVAGLTSLDELKQLREALDTRIARAEEVKSSTLDMLHRAVPEAISNISAKLNCSRETANAMLRGGIVYLLCNGDFEDADTVTDDGVLSFQALDKAALSKALAFTREVI